MPTRVHYANKEHPMTDTNRTPSAAALRPKRAPGLTPGQEKKAAENFDKMNEAYKKGGRPALKAAIAEMIKD